MEARYILIHVVPLFCVEQWITEFGAMIPLIDTART